MSDAGGLLSPWLPLRCELFTQHRAVFAHTHCCLRCHWHKLWHWMQAWQAAGLLSLMSVRSCNTTMCTQFRVCVANSWSSDILFNLMCACLAGATLVVLSLGNLCALDFQVGHLQALCVSVLLHMLLAHRCLPLRTLTLTLYSWAVKTRWCNQNSQNEACTHCMVSTARHATSIDLRAFK